MEAMILAAGAGKRLRPLTDRIPKALVEVGGRPLLGVVIQQLAEAGAVRIVINTHYHEGQIRAFLERNSPTGVEIVLSPEPDGPYDTGGGLFAAAKLFQNDGPILLHNVDVISQIPLSELRTTHFAARASSEGYLVASLAVQARDAGRQLVFDDLGLMGWENRDHTGAVTESRRVREVVGQPRCFSFTGIHVVEPSVFQLSQRSGTFSIITLYLELAAQGNVIRPVDVSAHQWIDIGTPERLAEANRVAGG
jgi:NDP-sugar pyrophosphorylase family protein